jgi:hypothetical protein
MGVIRRIVGAEGTGAKMEHWFDDLTKRLATPGLSRREMIGMTVAAGLETLGTRFPFGVFGSANALAHSHQTPTPTPSIPHPATPTGPCSIAIKGQQAVVNFSSEITLNGKTALFRKTVTKVLGLRGGTTDHTTVSFAGATLGVTGPAVEVHGLAQ